MFLQESHQPLQQSKDQYPTSDLLHVQFHVEVAHKSENFTMIFGILHDAIKFYAKI